MICAKRLTGLVLSPGKTIDLSDVWSDPVVRFQRRFYIPLVLLLWGAFPTYVCHYLTGKCKQFYTKFVSELKANA